MDRSRVHRGFPGWPSGPVVRIRRQETESSGRSVEGQDHVGRSDDSRRDLVATPGNRHDSGRMDRQCNATSSCSAPGCFATSSPTTSSIVEWIEPRFIEPRPTAPAQALVGPHDAKHRSTHPKGCVVVALGIGRPGRSVCHKHRGIDAEMSRERLDMFPVHLSFAGQDLGNC